MVAETVFDLLKLATAMPFMRNAGVEQEEAHKVLMRKKWEEQGSRLEMFIERNTKKGKVACTVGGSGMCVCSLCS